MFHLVIGLRGIKHVLVDIEGLMCAHGCCRLASDADTVFGTRCAKDGLRFAVRGQLCKGENALVAAALEKTGHTAFYDAMDHFEMPDDASESESDDDGDDDEDEEGGDDNEEEEDDDGNGWESYEDSDTNSETSMSGLPALILL